MKRSKKIQKTEENNAPEAAAEENNEPASAAEESFTPPGSRKFATLGEAVDARTTPRLASELQTIVVVRETTDDFRKEVTNVTTISKNGAGFSLLHPCTVGRLVTLVIPMPVEMRAYDEGETLYPIMGLVQYCNEGVTDGKKCYFVGVAFIGKRIPISYKENPLQSYRITGMSKSGLWTVVETEKAFKPRRYPRFWVALEVGITILKKERTAVYKEQAFTQNIGANGASVRCSLEANIGDKIKFAYKDFDFYTLAVIRDRRQIDGQMPTLHMEFVENKFPVERLPVGRHQAAGHEQEMSSDSQAPAPPPGQDSGPGAFEFKQN